MSPLLFLAIPLVVSVLGSTALYFGTRLYRGNSSLNNAPDDLRTVVPMLRDQRNACWPVGSGRTDVRS